MLFRFKVIGVECPHMRQQRLGEAAAFDVVVGECSLQVLLQRLTQRGLPAGCRDDCGVAPIDMPAARPAKQAMRRSSQAYASAELMKVLAEPGSFDPVRAQSVVRSARARGGCPGHAGRVRPAAYSFCINLRPAWSLHHSIRPSSARVASYVIVPTRGDV